MRKLIIAATLAAFAIPTMPALADPPAWAQNDKHGDKHDNRRDDRGDRRQDRHDDRRDNRADNRQAARNWQDYRRYDYNRPDPRYGNAYYADRYYRDGSYYQPRRLAANERIYRGQNGQYYCRRPDGTTGLIIGGIAGGVLGNIIAPGGSKTLGTLLGGGAGALIGQGVDRNNVRCR